VDNGREGLRSTAALRAAALLVSASLATRSKSDVSPSHSSRAPSTHQRVRQPESNLYALIYALIPMYNSIHVILRGSYEPVHHPARLAVFALIADTSDDPDDSSKECFGERYHAPACRK
jgi:hypothetical protein